MRTSNATLLLLLGTFLAGCGEESTGPSSNPWTESRAAQSAAATHCDCFTALGFPSAGACQSELDPGVATNQQAACIQELFDTSASTMNARFNCLTEVYGQFDTCLGAVSACDATAVEACLTELTTGLGVCPALDSTTQASFEGCLTNPG